MRLAIAGSKESGVETAENKSQEPPSSTTPTNNEKKHSEENDDDNNDGSSSLPQVTAQVQSYMVLGTRFDVPSTFSILNSVGSGAYGVVAAARDSTTDDIVAIKKIERAFEHQVFTKRTLRELKLLRAL